MASTLSIKDRDGHTVRVGDKVRVLAVPDLNGMRSPYREETESVFRHIKGAVKRVIGIDDFACAVLVFYIRTGPRTGCHSVAIEGAHIRRAKA